MDNRLCKVSRNINFYVATSCWPEVSTQIVISFQSVFFLYFEGIFVRFFAGIARYAKNSEQKDANMNNNDRLKHECTKQIKLCAVL